MHTFFALVVLKGLEAGKCSSSTNDFVREMTLMRLLVTLVDLLVVFV